MYTVRVTVEFKKEINMKFWFIGTGSAFSTKNYQTNTLIERNGKFFLIDAGGDLKFSLNEINKSYLDIDACYISHLHADHSGGVEYLAFCSYFDPKYEGKMKMFGESKMLSDGWKKTWRGGLESIQNKVMRLGDYFKVKGVPQNGSFDWEGISFQIVQSVHIMNGFTVVPTYGLIITDPDTGKKVFYTGDSQFCPSQIQDFYDSCDSIIQDCETYPFKSGVHANYEELRTLPEETKAKMWLQHYNDNIMDDEGNILKSWLNKAEEDGFKGFLIKGSTGAVD
jgi:ribonuclease BN (tRNA processing enzyme)